MVGALIAALAITLISLGFNNIKAWGMLLASPDAPFSVLGMSLSPIMILLGIFLGQAFFAWTRQREANKKTPLLALEVLDTPQERAATFSLLIIGAIGPAINFLIPLYIQIVQGRTSLATAVAVIPYSLAIFAATALVVYLFDRLTPRRIGRYGFFIVAVGLVLLAFTVQNKWGKDFVSNEQLDEVLEEKDLTPIQENAVININTEARLRALKLSFLVLAGIAMLAIFPAGGLPDYIPEEIPADNK